MQDLALYRKYRPESFDDVLGQDHIIKVLKGAIKLGNISHAYIFFGSRGTGKTSIARIVANELKTSPEDTFEIDAASNRGIDDIRELREGVRTLPFNSKYKVYIIDEVHMLTKEAWNALLKTLEEPPSHVVFILATTEIEKVPETIISRCQVFTFKKPTISVLKEMIQNVSKKEGFKIDSDGVEIIAMLGDGSFRDTHGILQKVMSFSADKKISLREIELVTSAPKGELVNNFLQALAERNAASGFSVIKKAVEQNVDIKIFLKFILFKLRLALLLRYAPETKEDILENIGDSDKIFLQSIIKEKEGIITSKSLEVLLETENLIRYASIPELALELAFVKIIEK